MRFKTLSWLTLIMLLFTANIALAIYDAELGRWLSRDPIGEDKNLYVYVHNTPLSYIDPDGQWGVGITIGGAANIGAGIVGGGGAGAVGGGLFWGGPSGVNGGVYRSGGACVRESPGVVSFQVPDYDQTPWVIGGYMGWGAGPFITNANKPCDLAGPFKQLNINTPWGSVSFGLSGGIWIGSITFGPGRIGDVSGYPTTTAPYPPR